jgi:hypothetical protein
VTGSEVFEGVQAIGLFEVCDARTAEDLETTLHMAACLGTHSEFDNH